MILVRKAVRWVSVVVFILVAALILAFVGLANLFWLPLNTARAIQKTLFA